MGPTARLGHFNIQMSGPHSLTQFYGVIYEIRSRECLETAVLDLPSQSTAFCLQYYAVDPTAVGFVTMNNSLGSLHGTTWCKPQVLTRFPSPHHDIPLKATYPLCRMQPSVVSSCVPVITKHYCLHLNVNFVQESTQQREKSCYLSFTATSSELFSAYCKSVCYEFRILLEENGTCIDVTSVKLSIFNFNAKLLSHLSRVRLCATP